jgi:hypothetical protein
MILDAPEAEGQRAAIGIAAFTVSKLRPVLAFPAEVPYILVRQLPIKGSHVEHASS